MDRRLAPNALRMPISLVRSATDTNKMFMMPMPPTNRERPVTKNPKVPRTALKPSKNLVMASCWLMAKSSGRPGSILRMLRNRDRASSKVSTTVSGLRALTVMT